MAELILLAFIVLCVWLASRAEDRLNRK